MAFDEILLDEIVHDANHKGKLNFLLSRESDFKSEAAAGTERCH